MTSTTSSEISAENFLDRAIAALSAADIATLRQLESAIPDVGSTCNPAEYLKKRAVFAELLGETARNLRLLRRITANRSFCPIRFPASIKHLQRNSR